MSAILSTTANIDSADAVWAWGEYQPSDEHPWTLELAGHLLRRATFGFNWQQLQATLNRGPRESVERLLRPGGDAEAFEHSMSEDEGSVAVSSGIETLRAWWLRRMLLTPHPLKEKMTLFWHSHFGVGNSRVDDSQLMWRHIQTLREHSLGSYRTLLEAAAHDPAVLLSVGAQQSRKSQPNEQFIEQLLQQYSVGAGHYGDEDLREAARAFTGWLVLRGQMRFFDHEHDEGIKQVFGQAGNWEAKDVVRIVLDQPATPQLIARKLYRWFISEVDHPSDQILKPLAEKLAGQYDVAEVVELILRSNLFYSKRAYRQRIKRPVEYGLGVAIALEGQVPTLPLAAACARLGEDLYNPPTVRGWLGGTRWINAATMVERERLAAEMLETGKSPYGGRLKAAEIAQQHGCRSVDEAVEMLLQLYLQDDLSVETRAALVDAAPSGSVATSADWLQKCTYRIVTSPQFQLC